MAQIPYDRLPEYLRQGMRRYIEDGAIPTDQFLQAVLTNDLAGAFRYADHDMAGRMRSIVMFVIFHVPADAWGSKRAVAAWTGTRNRKREETEVSA